MRVVALFTEHVFACNCALVADSLMMEERDAGRSSKLVAYLTTSLTQDSTHTLLATHTFQPTAKYLSAKSVCRLKCAE